MKLKEMIGTKIKVVQEKDTGKKEVSSKIGVLKDVRKHYFTVRFSNYRESFTNADVITPKHQSIYVRINKEWKKVTREMVIDW